MFGMMQGARVKVQANQMYPLDKVLAGSIRGEKADVGSLATVDERTAAVMVWSYHDDDVPGTGTEVTINFNGIPKKEVTMTQFRIDHKHSNSYEVWKKMGAPQQSIKSSNCRT